ncbi:type IV secretory system conjugative DNA transfer family protein [Geothrix sp. PMB-07]|uniref:type IV secretory system conjugative DNA transfer family protein n=1 Tax=Geothrix sp. PMB-07 TaxID=3068640 RepID=UPI00274183B3|nr:type IV secretion system DNA-binding domain-containing protein [Geothrix sp. PMB-07]WLT30655.1 type IV secretion system DNA-binding domain-containing protein [Geothrix sp. PMB-07]
MHDPNGYIQISSKFTSWYASLLYLKHPEVLPWAVVSLVGGAALIGASIYRMTRRGQKLAWEAPRTYKALNGPYVGPLAAASAAFGASALLPGFASGMADLRPEWFVYIGTLSPGWVASVTLPMAAVGLLGVVEAAKRLSREKIIETSRGKAHWAAWGEVKFANDHRWVLPIWVHYRGQSEEWKRGAGRTLVALPANTAVRHVFLVGQSGAAKGFGIFNPIISSSRVPFIYQDFKAEMPGYEILRERTGTEPIRWGAAADDGLPSMGWNPLEECKGNMNAIHFLAATLVPSRGADDWVSQLARPILGWILAHGGYTTLGDVYDNLVQAGVASVLDKSGVPTGLLAALEGKNVKEYLGTTIFSALAAFGSGWGRTVTSHHEFSIADMMERGGYVLSAEFDMSRRVPLTMFWRFIIRDITTSNRIRPMTLLFDEALAVGRIENINVVLETARSKGIGVVFGVQHEDGVRREYGDEAEALISGFASRIWLLNGLSTNDQERLRRVLGQRLVQEKGPDGRAGHHLADLLTKDDLARRANQYERWWAVVSAVGATKSGARILGQMVGAGFAKRPKAEDIEAEVQEATAISSTENAFYPTPELVNQSTTKVIHEDEIKAALAAAAQLEHTAGWEID